ncbi:hypothetical protein PTSG_07940 [Salpingoeca rosetta]|uniref:Uncharacterized protein n=1 Tax=Salpingoeca rosetta (strain ATCC 50818 / BSB-021) TaxID=946362 RepID=F2UGS1_SALR5|nr:uncharacterized protein PTSG_07940 [Salpingoeca rosetta]EGD75821.1 hypothetical protein PTSG_07940 [Salpingoeca rosetta]|eukprot:XP_004991742.1 hypothetical protein PTSG_07940 [Salpingoeca rosetta]
MAAHGRLSLAAIAAARRGRVHALRRSVVTPPLNRFTARLHVARGVRADDANNNDSSDHVTAIKNDQHRLPVQCAGCGVALQTQQPGGTAMATARCE